MSEDIDNMDACSEDGQTLESVVDEAEAYPIREASEDPRWAVRIVWVWVGMAMFLLLFFVVLMILGWWYD